MNMYIKSVISIVISIALLCSCTREKTIEGFSLPEGACSDGEFIYISNVGKEFKPLDKDGDGFISKLNRSGEIIKLQFIPQKGDTLHSPKGMGVINGVLYVTDIDKVLGYDLKSGYKVYELDFSSEHTQLLNDITVKNENTIYVSGMDVDKIYEVKTDTPSYKTILSLKKPNGLYWLEAEQSLYIGQFGRVDQANGANGDIGKLVFSDEGQEYVSLGTYQGNIDGVFVKKNKLYFTDWLSQKEKGTLRVMNLETKEVKDVYATGIDGPGDFYFDPISNTVWVPRMRENKVDRLVLN